VINIYVGRFTYVDYRLTKSAAFSAWLCADRLKYRSPVYIGWQWRKLFIPIYVICGGHQDVGQENVKILHQLPPDRIRKLIFQL